MANPNMSDPLFQYHHQPFAYFSKYADNTDARKQHLKDENDFYSDLSVHYLFFFHVISFLSNIFFREG